MMRVAPLTLLCVGVIIAGLFGARNGEQFTAYRSSIAMNETASLPSPSERLADWFGVGGLGLGVGLGMIAVGAVLARRQDADDAAGVGQTGPRLDFAREVERALSEVDEIARMLESLPMDTDHPDARDRLDRLAAEVFGPVVEARGIWLARHGLSVFSSYFSPYSAAERQLARAWSAITDGHAVVARSSVAAGRQSLEEARDAWRRVESA
jgi:hypothetical protein